MRLPRFSPWEFLSGLALLLLAFLSAVGSGVDIEVEHDAQHRRVLLVAALMASLGLVLLWLSLWPLGDKSGRRS